MQGEENKKKQNVRDRGIQREERHRHGSSIEVTIILRLQYTTINLKQHNTGPHTLTLASSRSPLKPQALRTSTTSVIDRLPFLSLSARSKSKINLSTCCWHHCDVILVAFSDGISKDIWRQNYIYVFFLLWSSREET